MWACLQREIGNTNIGHCCDTQTQYKLVQINNNNIELINNKLLVNNILSVLNLGQESIVQHTQIKVLHREAYINKTIKTVLITRCTSMIKMN